MLRVLSFLLLVSFLSSVAIAEDDVHRMLRPPWNSNRNRPTQAQGPKKTDKPGQGPKKDRPGHPHGLFNKECKSAEDDDGCEALENCQWCATNSTAGKCTTKRFSCCKFASEETTCTDGTTCAWWTSTFGSTTVGECKDVKCKNIDGETPCGKVEYCSWVDVDGKCTKDKKK